MPDTTAELEKPKAVETVDIGQEFLLLSPLVLKKSTTIYGAPRKHYKKKIHLGLNGQSVPFEFRAETKVFAPAITKMYANKANTFTPLDPELGYRVTVEDFDSTARVAKYQKSEDKHQVIDMDKAPLRLDIAGPDRVDDERFDLNEKTGQMLERVRLLITFPDGSVYETGPHLSPFFAWFPRFYNKFCPEDLGPLAVPKVDRQLSPEEKKLLVAFQSGLVIDLPEDIERLQQIKARFIIAPEEEEEDLPAAA